jgi:hypothetical protein
LGDAFPRLQKRVCKRFSTYYTPTRTARNGISMAILKGWTHSHVIRGVRGFIKAQESQRFFSLTGPMFMQNHPLLFTRPLKNVFFCPITEGVAANSCKLLIYIYFCKLVNIISQKILEWNTIRESSPGQFCNGLDMVGMRKHV